MKNNIAKNVLPNILSNLFEMKKKNQIIATDSAIRKYAKKQANDYADKASKYVINKSVKTAVDTVMLTYDNFKSLKNNGFKKIINRNCGISADYVNSYRNSIGGKHGSKA